MLLYKRAWALFRLCNQELGLLPVSVASLPLSVNQVSIYVSYLHQRGLSPASMVSYTCAIGYVHRLMGFKDPTSSNLVQKLLAGAVKLSPRSVSRLPITLIMLGQLGSALNFTVDSHYHRVLVHSMFMVGFFGLMRIGELTQTKHKLVPLHLHQLTLFQDKAIVRITHFKHNHKLKPVDIPLVSNPIADICPLRSLLRYLAVRGNSPGPLFAFPGMVPVPRDFFTSHLQQALSFCGFHPDKYKSHSLRIGGASYLAELGYSDAQIRLMGRWSSNAFIQYIRAHRAVFK